MLTAFTRAFRTPDLRKKLALHALHHRGVPAGLPAAGAGREHRSRPPLCRRGDQGRQRQYLRVGQPVQRRCAAQAVDLRAGHHAVHHREHHPAAADRGDPAPGDAPQGGPGRHHEDHAVHALPDDRSGDPPGHRHRRDGEHRQPAAGLHRGPALEQGLVHHRHDGHRDHRGHVGDHVAGRARHRPRHRQRHVDPDLHPGRRGLPERVLEHLQDQARLRLRDRAPRRASRSSPASSSSSRPSAASRCSTPSAWSAAGCTAAPRPTSR